MPLPSSLNIGKRNYTLLEEIVIFLDPATGRILGFGLVFHIETLWRKNILARYVRFLNAYDAYQTQSVHSVKRYLPCTNIRSPLTKFAPRIAPSRCVPAVSFDVKRKVGVDIKQNIFAHPRISNHLH